MKTALCLMQLGCSVAALAAETIVPLSAQQGVNVTIYNENRALVKDERKVELNSGLNELAFQGVFAMTIPWLMIPQRAAPMITPPIVPVPPYAEAPPMKHAAIASIS